MEEKKTQEARTLGIFLYMGQESDGSMSFMKHSKVSGESTAVMVWNMNFVLVLLPGMQLLKSFQSSVFCAFLYIDEVIDGCSLASKLD